ncbi:MAG: major capsid protein [Cyanobacteria bacterium P01_F01_bin.116]
MPQTFYELFENLQEERYFERLALDPQAQFGSENQQLLGAQLLPEQIVEENSYEETQVRYRVQPALDNNRYSPTQKQKGSHLIGTFRVDLGHTDTQKDLSGKDFDDIRKLLMRGGDNQAIANTIQWFDREIIRPHTIKNEIQRWQAILKAQVTRETADGEMQSVDYYRPQDHVVTIPGGTTAAEQGWHLGTYDPFDDIETGVEKLKGLGYALTGIYSTPYLARVLRINDQVIARYGRNQPNDTRPVARINEGRLNQVLQDEDYTTLTTYNGGYESGSGFQRYMDVEAGYDYMLLTGSTQRRYDMASDYAGATGVDVSGFTDGAIVLNNTLGYYAIGKNAGRDSSGRSTHQWINEKKPIGMGAESYQTGLPVLTDPQSYYVIRVERPTAA